MSYSACFLGLGAMGSAMAANLLKNRVKLYVYNRTPQKAQKLVKDGAAIIDTPSEAYDHAPVVFSMVANDQALTDICMGENGLLKNPRKGSIHVSMSTVSPKLIQELSAKHKEKGILLMSAPVFGRPDAAAQQKLFICMAGPSEAKKQVEPLLKFMGQTVRDFGEKPEGANAIKLTGNFMILSLVELMAESYSFAEKSGIDPNALHEFFSETLFPAPPSKIYGNIINHKQFTPAGFKMPLGLKDIDLLLKAADKLKVPMPVASLLHERLLTGLAHHREELDWSAISLTQFEDAGLIHEMSGAP